MIEVENLNKSFGDNHVVKNLSVSIKDGETIVILGQSGVGKSVLLRHIMGLLAPDSGSIKVANHPIKFLKDGMISPPCVMGMLFQSGALFDSMNIEENIAFYLKQHQKKHGYTQSEIRDRVTESLQLVRLEGVEKKMPSELSGGMKKRVALARLIAYHPKILLYDEPTSGLDPITSMQIGNLIKEIQGRLQATSIVVSHDLPLSFRIADRIAFYHDGHLAYIEPPKVFAKIKDPMIQAFIENSKIAALIDQQKSHP